MLCPNKRYVEREIDISSEEAHSIEALCYEIHVIKNVLQYIADNRVDLPADRLAAYKKEYFESQLRLQKSMEDLLSNYVGADFIAAPGRINFELNKLIWVEEVKG